MSTAATDRVISLRVALENLRAEGCDFFGCKSDPCPLCVVEGAILAEREACAQVAEQHLDHIDTCAAEPLKFANQSHVEAPYRCNVAEAIRSRK